MEGLLVRPRARRRAPRPARAQRPRGPRRHALEHLHPGTRLWAWPLFAQKGYAIFFPNPRGSGGYGERFRAANVRDWGVKDYEDLMLGVDALVERGIADPARLAVNGWSYGGFMTSTIVTKTDRFKSAIVGAAVTNLASFAGTADIPEFARSYFRSWPWEDPQVYVDRSALFHAGKVKTPSLVVHGDDATTGCPCSQGWEFYNALAVLLICARACRPSATSAGKTSSCPASPTASASRSCCGPATSDVPRRWTESSITQERCRAPPRYPHSLRAMAPITA
jgi:hypothetical protein